MRVRTVVGFGVGYVLGARAGSEGYTRIIAVTERVAERLESYARDHDASRRSGD